MRSALAALAIAAGVAHADPVDDDRAFRAAGERAAAGDPAAIEEAIDAFEAVGRAQPASRWTDDAWAEAAELAERSRDFPRARRDLVKAIEVGTDEQLVRRARAALARLDAITGAGTWDAVAAEHERLAGQIGGRGDPTAALAGLEALIRANPRYPRATVVRLAIAAGWEREAAGERAIAWLREAVAVAAGADLQRARIALASALVRQHQLDDAERVLAQLSAAPGADRAAIAAVADALGTARNRAELRAVLWVALGLLAVAAALMVRRETRSWRAAARRLSRPPIEVVFLIPIAIVLVAVAWTGNPLVARSVRAIAGIGVGVGWISGALLEAARTAHGRVSTRRAIVQGLLAVLAVVAATYLALDRDRMIDLVAETWHAGPAMR